jgi:hypothetical protein
VPENNRPWWEANEELQEFVNRSMAEFEREGAELECARRGRTVDDGPDPVLAEVLSGECRRALATARDDLDRARDAYDAAVRAARTAGYSWGEIGRIVGVSKQVLHRRFR